MASNLLVMASNLVAMASNLIAVASNLLAMASNLLAMASNPIAMPSNLIAKEINAYLDLVPDPAKSHCLVFPTPAQLSQLLQASFANPSDKAWRFRI